MKKVLRTLNSETGYIGVMMFFVAIITSLYLIMAFQEPIFKKFSTNYLVQTVVRQVEEDGEINDETLALINDIGRELGLNDYHPKFNFTGQISGNNHIQLRDTFYFEYEFTVPIKVVNPLVLDAFTIDFKIRKQLKGYSQKYFRPSEL